MGVEDLPWRKFPRDAISNVKIRFIQKQLAPHLRHGALLFFTTAYCLADDYGVIDIEDGLVFADAMDIDNPDDVFVIANLFASRGIMDKITERIFMFVEWDTPNRDRTIRAPLTAEQRRAAVQAQLKQKEMASDNMSDTGQKTAKDVATKSEKMSLYLPCSDKKRENVATHREKTDKRVQKEEREKKETHTQEAARLAHDALCAHSAPCAIAQALTPDEKRERKKENRIETGENQESREKKEATESKQPETPENDKETEITNGREGMKDRTAEPCKGVNGQEYLDTLQVLQDFFDKYNPMGYQNKDEQIKALIELTHRMIALSDKANTGEIIAINFCRCFKKLVEQHQYYKDMPILPSNLLKNGVFSIILGEVGRILQPKGVSWQRHYDKMVAESAKGKQVYSYSDFLAAQCKQYNVNPDAPDYIQQLLAAQKAKKQQVGADDTG